LFIAVETQRGAHGIDGIADISAQGAALLLPPAEMPPLALHEKIQLSIRSPHVDGSLTVDAEVLSRVRGRHGWVYRFAFDNAEPAFEHAYGTFFESFNRRATYRGVRTTVDAPVQARVRIAGADSNAGFDVDVLNVSTGGLCVAASLDVDAVLAEANALRVRVRLPNQADPVEFATSVRYRAVDDAAVVYGLQFEPNGTPDFPAKLDTVQAYVTSRFEPAPDSVWH
jgi:hypothetical protein